MITEIEMIKKIYSNSENNIIILDYNLKCIWHNDTQFINQFNENKYESLFKMAKNNKLKNGNYYFEYNSQKYFYTLKNIPDIKNGICIIEFFNDDIFTAFLKDINMGKTIEKYIAGIRQNIFGITNVNQALYQVLERNDLYNDIKYINSSQSNCRKMMKVIVCTTEALKYSDNEFSLSQVYLTKELENMIRECRNVLKSTSIIIESSIEENIFIEVDKERLNYCLLILMDFLYDNNKENNVIIINLKKINDEAVISFSTDSRGVDKTGAHNHSQLYSKENYSELKFNVIHLHIIRSFCKAFGLTLIEGVNSEEKKYISIKFPPIKNTGNVFNISSTFSSETCEYRDKFSKYNILLTDFIE